MNNIDLKLNDIEGIDFSLDVAVKKIEPPLEDLEVTPTKEQQKFNHENSYKYDNVVINPIPDEYIIPDGTLPITENTTYDVTKFARVTASVHPAPNLQDKELTINENGTHKITADDEFDGLNEVSVTVNAIEDLTEELNTYDTELTEQETKIADVIELLQTKATPSAEKYAPRRISFQYHPGDNLDYEFANLDASNITDLRSFCEGCTKMATIDLSSLTFGKITDINHMFCNNASATNYIFGDIDTSAVTKLFETFKNNVKLPRLDLSCFDLSNVTNMYYTFWNCKALTYLNVSTINFSKVIDKTNMMINVPTTCEIIVGTDTDKSWFATNFSDYKNVKTVAEWEAEQ